MKRLLTFIFIFTGVILAGELTAQTTGTKGKKDSKPNSTNANKGNASGSGAGGITIDEGGQSRPTKGKSQSTAPGGNSGDSTKVSNPANPQSATPKSSETPGAPEIAIDEGGQTRPTKGKSQTTAEPTPSGSDSAIKAPAEMIGRPQRRSE